MIKELLKEYINNNLEQEQLKSRVFKVDKLFEESCLERESSIKKTSCSIEEYIEQENKESKFQKLLFKYIDSKDLKDSDVYNKAGIDRRLFSKIRTDQNYHPSKETIILLSLALELNEDEMLSLLNSASYTLPKNNVYDLIIRFCFINKIYDINEVNNLLYEYNIKTLN